MQMEIVCLGTGTSVGVPVIGCGCRVCQSDDPRNRRLRQSVLIRHGGYSILVDAGADLRQQALNSGLAALDAVLLTHSHADHIFGLDETRVYAYRQRKRIPVYGSKSTLEGVRKTFWYAFDGCVQEGGGIPKLDMQTIEGPFEVCGLQVTPLELDHGVMKVTGFRIGDFAYLTDCKSVPDARIPQLQGLDTLMLNALRQKPDHPTHMTVGQALEVVGRLAPRRTFLIHMGHEIEHGELEKSLPPGVSPAYDGLEISIRL